MKHACITCKSRAAGLGVAAVLVVLAMLACAVLPSFAHAADNAWSGSLFSKKSTTFSVKLAKVASEMCDVAQGNDAGGITRLLKDDWNFDDAVATNYWGNEWIGGSAAFTVGHDTLRVGDKRTVVLVVVPRGSYTNAEFIGDFAKGGKQSFLGEKVWGNVLDFEKQVWSGISSYLTAHPRVKSAKHLSESSELCG